MTDHSAEGRGDPLGLWLSEDWEESGVSSQEELKRGPVNQAPPLALGKRRDQSYSRSEMPAVGSRDAFPETSGAGLCA